MPNMATPFFKDGRFYPTLSQMLEAVDQFDALTARGLGLNAIADAMEVTRGSVCVIRRWSLERAAGMEPRVEISPSVIAPRAQGVAG